MNEIFVYMLILVSWSGNAESPKIERFPELFISQEACEAQAKRVREMVKADREMRRLRTAFECLQVPDPQEYDAAFADAQPKK
ncbi:hypothetical protein [Pseudonocardia sp. TMWB2A]|uniref:hypothetical protein n=1 Tax=Pseudonocardia sp. TMWB2A TaxID=687430 RepID=UPI00307CE096